MFVKINHQLKKNGHESVCVFLCVCVDRGCDEEEES